MRTQRKLLQWCGGSLWSPRDETVSQETWDLLAENSTSLMIKIYKHTDTFKYSEPQPPSHRSFVASNVWPPRPLHSRWRTASCAESWRVCAPWRTGSRVRWAPQFSFQPVFFPQFFALSEVGAAIACKSAASGDPRPFVPVWRELMQP